MKRYWVLFIVVLGAFAVVFGGIPPGYAQEDDDDEFQLEDVVVTAMKREQDHQSVPIQMEVISGTELEGTGKDNIDDILRDIANLMVNKNHDGMRITLRGLSEDDSAMFDLRSTTPMVAINVDGTYDNASTAGQNLFDVERLEVLSGPQSTMYGSNSPGGIVNVVTAAPKTDRFEVKASAEAGNSGLFDAQAVVNVPIIKDKLAVRLAAQFYERDSWTQGQTNPQDTDTVRVKALFEPNDTFSVGVTYNYSTSIAGGRLNGSVRAFDYEDGHYMDGSPVTNPWTSDAVPAKGGKGISNAPPSARTSDSEITGWKADINLDTPIGNISFIPYVSNREATSFRNDVEVLLPGQTEPMLTSMYRENSNEQEGAELRIASPEDFPFDWIVGGTYYDSVQRNFTDDFTFDFNDGWTTLSQNNKAIYANITYPFTDKFRGTAGYRRSWDDSGMVEIPAKVKDGITGQKYEKPDYKAGIEYDLSQESMLYASWSTSYRVNFMADATEERPVPPEELTAYTVGVKNRFLNDKLQLNAAVYFYDYEA